MDTDRHDRASTPGTPPGRRDASEGGPGRAPPVVETASLFQGGREVVIAHRGESYRLRITQNGKLILTK